MSTPKMHVNEVDTNAVLVRRLITAQFPQWSHLSIKKLNSAGTDHALYRLGDEMVVRLPRTPSASGQIDKEYQWLPKLAPFLPLDIPTPLATGTPAQGYPWHWSVYWWLVGEDASVTSVVDEHQTAIALAEFLLALHQVDPTGGPSPGAHNFFRGVPLALRDKSTRATIATLHHTFDVDLMVKLWDDSLAAPLWVSWVGTIDILQTRL